MRSSPKPSFGHGLSDSTSSTAESIELPPVARELLAFGLHDVGRRVLNEAPVREHPLRAGDLLLQALDLGRRVAVAGRLRRPYDRLKDAQVLAFQRNTHAAAAEDLGRVLDHLERIRVGRVGTV